MYTIWVNFIKENQAAPDVILNDVERDNSDFFPKSTFSIIYSQDFLPLKLLVCVHILVTTHKSE